MRRGRAVVLSLLAAGTLAALVPACGAFDYDCNDPQWIGANDLSVSEGQARQNLEIEATLLDAEGSPIPNVKVDLYLIHPSGTGSGDYGGVAGTGPDGVYRTDLSVHFGTAGESTLMSATGYQLSFRPRNKVDGVQYCDEVVERDLDITS